MRYFLPFFFFFNLLHCQTAVLDSLFVQFDSYRYDDVKSTLSEIDKNILPKKTNQDLIRYSLYTLLDLNFNSKQTSESYFQKEYSKALDFLIEQGLADYLPYFITKYSSYLATEERYFLKSVEYLDIAIEVAKKNKNLSHFTSVSNLFNLLEIKDIIRSIHDSNYNDEELISLIEHFENYKNELSFVSNEKLFKKYYLLTSSKFIDVDLRKRCLKNTLVYGDLLDEIPSNYGMRDLFFRLRHEDKENIELKLANNHFKLISNKNKFFKLFDFNVNDVYINKFSNSSVTNFIDFIKSSNLDFDKLSDDRHRDIYYVISKARINFQKFVLQDKKKDQWDSEYFFKLLDFSYEYYKENYDSVQLSRVISCLILFFENDNTDIYYDSSYDLLLLQKEYGDVLYEAFNQGRVDEITPQEFTELIKNRALYYFSNKSLEENEQEVLTLFDTYKNNVEYKDLVGAMESYFLLEQSFSSYGIEGYDSGLRNVIKFIKSNLENNITPEDIELRIRISYNEDSSELEEAVKDFYKKSLISQSRLKNLEFLILTVKLTSNYNFENAEKYYDYFLSNIETKGFSSYVNNVMNVAVDFKIEKNLVKLSNYLLKIYDQDFINKLSNEKYLFQISAGYYFKFIKNYSRSIKFFLDARANGYHTRKIGFTYEDLTKDNSLIYQIFDLTLKLDYFNDQSRYYLNEYKRLYNNLIKEVSKVTQDYPMFNNDTFINIKRNSLDMERRLLYNEGNHIESEKIIDLMIDLEKKYPFWGIFELELKKYSSIFLQRKYGYEKLRTMLENLYLKHNKEYDLTYYSFLRDFGDITNQLIDIQLDNFINNNKTIQIASKLSYENQIKYMKNLRDVIFKIENDVFKFDCSKEQIKKLSEIRINIDNIDIYNTKLLLLPEDQADKYFSLLNDTFTIKDFDKLQTLKAKFDVFQQKIKLSSEDRLGSAKISAFQHKLNNKQAYVRFSFVSFDKYLAYIITKDNIELVKLEQSKIDKLVDYYTNRIKNKLEDSYSYDVFFKPIADKLPSDINEIFIKNYGLLSNVNFEALRSPTTNRFVFEDYKINYVERPESALSMDNSISISSAFLFGNPDFTYNLEETGSVSSIRSGLNPLPFTEVEINILNDVLTKNGISTVTTNLYESTEQALYENSKSDIIHLATHGFYIDGESTDRFNWGLLASGSKEVLQNDFKKIRREDGIIFGSEIILKNFTKAKLVVLSACETGYGTTTFFGGENLANSFLRAGAKNIISTLWPVDDEITQLFMTEFYTDLLITKNINLSLRNTKLKIKEYYPEPLYWAPFVLTQNDIK